MIVNSALKFFIRFLILAMTIGLILIAISSYAAVTPHNMNIRGTEVIDIRKYGAKPDDDIDDYVAIASAVADLGSGQTLWFPPGEWRVSQAVTLQNKYNCRIRMDGTIRPHVYNASHNLFRLGTSATNRVQNLSGNIKVGSVGIKDTPSSVQYPVCTGVYAYGLYYSDILIEACGLKQAAYFNADSTTIRLGEIKSCDFGVEVNGYSNTVLGGLFLYPLTNWVSNYGGTYGLYLKGQGNTAIGQSGYGDGNYLRLGGSGNKVEGFSPQWDYSSGGSYGGDMVKISPSGIGNTISFNSRWTSVFAGGFKSWIVKELNFGFGSLKGNLGGNELEWISVSSALSTPYAWDGAPAILKHTLDAGVINYHQGFLTKINGGSTERYWFTTDSIDPSTGKRVSLMTSPVASYSLYVLPISNTEDYPVEITGLDMWSNVTGIQTFHHYTDHHKFSGGVTISPTGATNGLKILMPDSGGSTIYPLEVYSANEGAIDTPVWGLLRLESNGTLRVQDLITQAPTVAFGHQEIVGAATTPVTPGTYVAANLAMDEGSSTNGFTVASSSITVDSSTAGLFEIHWSASLYTDSATPSVCGMGIAVDGSVASGTTTASVALVETPISGMTIVTLVGNELITPVATCYSGGINVHVQDYSVVIRRLN